ncbi:MAG: HD domain-containing protein [Chloroflexota bacterium]
MINYFAIIHKYIAPTSPIYRYYVPHVTLVTCRALAVAKRLGLTKAQMIFIEEAAMLHDIGIVQVDAKEIGCQGDLPYICHGVEGRKILEAEKLPIHALVAERHTGVGISKSEVIKNEYPLPKRDFIAVSLEEKIISWADLFYSKNPNKVWQERSIHKARKQIAKFGANKARLFDEWHAQFEEDQL